VGKTITSVVRTGFNEVETTCDIGFKGTYLTCAWSAVWMTNSPTTTMILLKKDGIFMIKTGLITFSEYLHIELISIVKLSYFKI
jgi:hypothetical protein